MMSAPPPPTPPSRHHLLHHHHHHHPSQQQATATHHANNSINSSLPVGVGANNSAGAAVGNNCTLADGSSLEDKHSLKMKIKRTKPSSKTSEAKHEIVKPSDVALETHDALISPVTAGNINNQLQPANHPVPSATANVQHQSAAANGNSQMLQQANGTATPPIARQTIQRHAHKKDKRRHDINGTLSPSTNLQQVQQQQSLHQQQQQQSLHQQQQQIHLQQQHHLQQPLPASNSSLIQQLGLPQQIQTTPGKSSAGLLQHTPLRPDALPPTKRLKVVSTTRQT